MLFIVGEGIATSGTFQPGLRIVSVGDLVATRGSGRGKSDGEISAMVRPADSMLATGPAGASTLSAGLVDAIAFSHRRHRRSRRA